MRASLFLEPVMGGRRRGQPLPNDIGLPVRPFLYTLDQIAGLVSVQEGFLRKHHVHYDGRSVGVRPKDKLLARNIAPDGDKPDWRVAEQELIRWMKGKGFYYYERGWVGI